MRSWEERTDEEEGFNAVSHGLWAVASFCTYFWALSSGALGLSVMTWGALIAAGASTIYHASPSGDRAVRAVTRQLDKTAIFITIGAGLLGFGLELGSTALPYSLLAALIMLAAGRAYYTGAISDDRSESWYAVGALSVVPLLIMTALAHPSNPLPALGCGAYLVGWLCYRAGDSVPWSHSVWHCAVVLGWLAHALFLAGFSRF